MCKKIFALLFLLRQNKKLCRVRNSISKVNGQQSDLVEIYFMTIP